MSTRLHDDETDVRDHVVRALVDDHDPAWRGLPLRRMPSTGTDNVIYRLGDRLGVRFPRIHWAVDQVAKEARWLPVLAPHLPCAVPEPVAVGEPGHGYPHRWLVFRWLAGTDLGAAAPVTGALSSGGWERLAGQLGDVARGLHDVRVPDAPAAGSRGRPLAPHDDDVRRLIGDVASLAAGREFDARRARAVWDEALTAPAWDREPVWVHGDLLPGNVLLDARDVVGLIDWSAAGLGDPACDAMIAWALPPAARRAFRDAAQVDDATWARASGWVVQQAVAFIPYYRDTLPHGVEAAWQRLEAVLAQPVATG